MPELPYQLVLPVLPAHGTNSKEIITWNPFTESQTGKDLRSLPSNPPLRYHVQVDFVWALLKFPLHPPININDSAVKNFYIVTAF